VDYCWSLMVVIGGVHWIPLFCLALVALPPSPSHGAANPRSFRSSAGSFGSILGGVSAPHLWQPPARCCVCDGVVHFVDWCRTLGRTSASIAPWWGGGVWHGPTSVATFLGWRVGAQWHRPPWRRVRWHESSFTGKVLPRHIGWSGCVVVVLPPPPSPLPFQLVWVGCGAQLH
jgi:hypothetical protein